MYKSALGNSSSKKSPVVAGLKILYIRYVKADRVQFLDEITQTCLPQMTPCSLSEEDRNVHSSQPQLASQTLLHTTLGGL